MPTPEEFDSWRIRLWDEIVGLHDAREQYISLFGHSPCRIEILNACAAWFFGVIQRTLFREQILGISRLTDQERTGSKSNLVLRSLLSDPALADRPEVIAELEAAIAAAENAAEPIRTHRHKYIAHLDHAVAIGASDSLLPQLKRGQVDEAVTLIESAYNIHGSRIRDSHAFFSVETSRGAEALVAALETSERWRSFCEIKRKKESGEY
jgi:hypothetical protein